MNLDKLLIAIGIFVMFTAGGVLVMYGSAENDGIFDDYNITEDDSHFDNVRLQNLTKVYGISSDVKDDIVGQEVTTATSWETMLKGAYSAFKTFLGTFAIAGNVIMSVGVELGIPTMFLQFGGIVLSIVVIFTVIYMLFRFQPRD